MDKVNKNPVLGQSIPSFSGLDHGRERGREEEDPSPLFIILGVPSVGIRLAKN